MPIYEYYCADNHKIYQFFAKSVAQGQTIPKCPDNPAFRMERIMSAFAITGGGKEETVAAPSENAAADPANEADDARLEAAFEQLEGEMDSVDENDPRAMGRVMRRMSELSGEKLDESMEEVVRKLEEGSDPEKLEEQMGDVFPENEDSSAVPAPESPRDFPGTRALGGRKRGLPERDPKLYDY